LKHNKQISQEILEANYWETFKFAKELAQFLPINNPKRLLLERTMAEQLREINNLKNVKANSKTSL